MVLLALPAFAHEPILKQIAPYISPGAWVGAVPARGGFDLCARDIFKGHPFRNFSLWFSNSPLGLPYPRIWEAGHNSGR